MHQSGTTLTELMVVLGITAILAVIAVPSLAAFASETLLANTANALVSSLHLARSEAIKRGSRAVLCKSPDGVACAAGGGWEQGWIVFHDANNNAARDEGETVAFTQPAVAMGMRVTGNSPVARYVSYTPTGATEMTSGAFQAGTFTLCGRTSDSGVGRQVVISSTGRPRTVKAASGVCA